MDQDPYDVSSFYKKSGIVQRVARSDMFNYLTLAALCTNVVCIGFDADSEEDSTALKVFENLFCCFFVVELLIRLGAFQVRADCLKDMCFKFDLALVVMWVFDSWLLPIVLLMAGADENRRDGFIQVVRLLRLVRIIRLTRALPELVTMVKGLCTACWAVLRSTDAHHACLHLWHCHAHAPKVRDRRLQVLVLTTRFHVDLGPAWNLSGRPW